MDGEALVTFHYCLPEIDEKRQILGLGLLPGIVVIELLRLGGVECVGSHLTLSPRPTYAIAGSWGLRGLGGVGGVGGAADLGLDLLALLEDGGHGACGIRLTSAVSFPAAQ